MQLAAPLQLIPVLAILFSQLASLRKKIEDPPGGALGWPPGRSAEYARPVLVAARVVFSTD